MNLLTRSERLGLLLNILGDDAMTLARTGLQGDALAELEHAWRNAVGLDARWVGHNNVCTSGVC